MLFGFAFPSPFALCPWLGGVEEFDGVFGGSFSFVRSAAFSASKAVTRTTRSSIRANSVAISVSFSAAEREGISGAGVIES
ncbi:MAG TPA: hypothetical protein VF515_00385 [Candidatus Binatia bacterium]